jgi:hypothetical protein
LNAEVQVCLRLRCLEQEPRSLRSSGTAKSMLIEPYSVAGSRLLAVLVDLVDAVCRSAGGGDGGGGGGAGAKTALLAIRDGDVS